MLHPSKWPKTSSYQVIIEPRPLAPNWLPLTCSPTLYLYRNIQTGIFFNHVLDIKILTCLSRLKKSLFQHLPALGWSGQAPVTSYQLYRLQPQHVFFCNLILWFNKGPMILVSTLHWDFGQSTTGQKIYTYTQIKYLFKPIQILSLKKLRLSFEDLKTFFEFNFEFSFSPFLTVSHRI